MLLVTWCTILTITARLVVVPEEVGLTTVEALETTRHAFTYEKFLDVKTPHYCWKHSAVSYTVTTARSAGATTHENYIVTEDRNGAFTDVKTVTFM